MAKQPTHVDTNDLSRRITRAPFPGSRKIYIDGPRPDMRGAVPRDLAHRHAGARSAPVNRAAKPNPPLRVYDASGPYTDPDAPHRHHPRPARLAHARGSTSVGDTEVLPGLAAPTAASA